MALSLKSPSPDIIRHRSSLEPGLSSRLRQGFGGQAPPGFPSSLSAEALAEAGGRPTLWQSLASSSVPGFQEQAEKYRAALAVDDSIEV